MQTTFLGQQQIFSCGLHQPNCQAVTEKRQKNPKIDIEFKSNESLVLSFPVSLNTSL